MKRLFRACQNMRYKKGTVEPGTLVWLDKPEETIERLLSLQVIAPVRCPPLEAFPGWEERALALEMEGIAGVEQFLGADPEIIAKALDESVEEIASWQAQLTSWLSAA